MAIQEDDLLRKFIRDCFSNPSTRQLAINYLKVKFRYYESEAGHLWLLSEQRSLTRAEEVRRNYHRNHIMMPEEKEAWQDMMTRLTNVWATSPIGAFVETVNEEYKPTPKERIAQIPYRLGYYLSYPFLWLAYQIWDGIEDAYLDIWE